MLVIYQYVEDCRGETHRIAYDGKSLILLNHNLVHETAAVTLGDAPCRCMKLLQHWRNRVSQPFHGDMFNAIDQTIRKSRERANNWFSHRLVTLNQRTSRLAALSDRVAHRTAARDIAAELLKRLYSDSYAYRPVAGQKALGGRLFVVDSIATHRSPGKPLVHVDLPLYWKRDVYDRGLAVIDNYFIIDVLTDKHVEHGYARKRAAPWYKPWWLDLYIRTRNPIVMALRRCASAGTKPFQYPAEVVDGRLVWADSYELQPSQQVEGGNDAST